VVVKKTWVKLAWLIVFILIVSVSKVGAQHEHEFFTGATIRVRWDPGALALGHEWRVVRVDDGVVVANGDNVLANLPPEEQCSNWVRGGKI